MSNKIVDVLAINALVENINIVALTLLDLGYRLDQSFVLLDALAVPINIDKGKMAI